MSAEIQKNERQEYLEVEPPSVRAFTQHYFCNRDPSVVGRSCAAAVSQLKNASGKNSAGFTLIEVMVVMAIISIMAGIIISSLGNGRTVRELETNAREFASVVREAQNYALTGKTITASGIPAGAVPCSFRVSWTGSDYSLIYIYKSSSSADCNSPSTYSIVTFPFKNGVTVSSGGPVDFRLPHAVVTGFTNVNFSKSSLSYTVCISAEGRITDHASGTCP